MRLLHILSVSALLLVTKPAIASPTPEFERQLFIETWAKIAVDHMVQYGIPASITLAQAIVESGWGKGAVAVRGNNYFCIKSNNGWAGPVVKAMDDEADSSSFRKYLTIEESFRDHSKFLRENSRYRPLFQLSPTDYRAWAYGLKSCGYATAKDYAEQLVANIEKYGLYLYDSAVPIEQVRALNAQFEPLEEPVAGDTTLPSAAPMPDVQSLAAQKTDVQPALQPTVANVAVGGAGQLLAVPGYRLGGSAMPAHAAPSDNAAAAKLPLILPKAAPKFQRRK